jgi:hypothetical protein
MPEIDKLVGEDLLKGLGLMNKELGVTIERLDIITSKSEQFDTNMKKMGVSTSGVQTKQKNLNTANKEAVKLQKELKLSEDEIVKSRLKHQQATKNQRDTLNALVTLEDKEAGSLQKLAARSTQLRKEREKLNLETKQGQKRLIEINRELDSNNTKLKSSSDVMKKQRLNVGNYSSALDGLPGPIGRIKMMLGNLSKVLMANPIVLLIAAIVAAIAAIGKALGRSQETIDKWRETWAKIKAVIDVIIDRLTAVGETLIKVFKGEAKLRDLKDAFKGVGDEIRVELKLAGELQRIMTQLERTENDLIITSAIRTAKIAELKEAASDQTKTELERIAALKEAQKIIDEETRSQKDVLATRIANKLGLVDQEDALKRINQIREDGLQLTLDEIGLSRSTEEDRKEVNELIAKFIGLEEQAAREKRTTVSLMSSMEKRLTAEKAKELEEQKKLYADLEPIAIESSNRVTTNALKNMDHIIDKNNEIIEKAAINEEMDQQRFEEGWNMKLALADQGTALIGAMFERQSAKFEKEKERELAAAGDNEAAKEKIEEKYAKKQNQLRRKQAMAEKLNAMFGIGVNTAVAITKALPNPLLVAFVATLGALQLATVSAKPLPGFKKGTKSSPEGWATVAEAGRELGITPGGDMFLTSNSPEMRYLEGGTEIIPNSETERILRASRGRDANNGLLEGIRQSNREVVEAIRNKAELTIIPSKSKITERRGNYYKEYLNSKVIG